MEPDGWNRWTGDDRLYFPRLSRSSTGRKPAVTIPEAPGPLRTSGFLPVSHPSTIGERLVSTTPYFLPWISIISIGILLLLAMSRTLNFYRRVSRLGLTGRALGFGAAGRRPFSASAAVSAPGSLPLEGYRVLDMTRVLAGVRHALEAIWIPIPD